MHILLNQHQTMRFTNLIEDYQRNEPFQWQFYSHILLNQDQTMRITDLIGDYQRHEPFQQIFHSAEVKQLKYYFNQILRNKRTI
jgi:hypothetical protein